MRAKHDPELMARIIAWLSNVLAPKPALVPVRITRDTDPRDMARRGVVPTRRL